MSQFITMHKLFPYPTNGKALQTIQNILLTNPDNYVLFVALSLMDKDVATLKLQAYRGAFDILEEKEYPNRIELRMRCKSPEDLMRWKLQSIKETVEQEYRSAHLDFCLKNNLNPLTLEALK